MRNLFILFVLVYSSTAIVHGQQQENGDSVKYVIFTSDKKANETHEGIFKLYAETILEAQSAPSTFFYFVSKTRGISSTAINYRSDIEKLSKIRKVTEKDKLVIKEESEKFLNSVDLIDMDVLFPKMSKEEFIKTWNGLWNKTVYFIDRSEIKNHKVKLYPVKIVGINLY